MEWFWWVLIVVLAVPATLYCAGPCLRYVRDWGRYIVLQKGIISTRNDGNGTGDYYWGKGSDIREAFRQIAEQLKAAKVKWKWCRCGGIYIYDRAVSKEVYEALNKHFAIATTARLMGKGPLMTFIEAPS